MSSKALMDIIRNKVLPTMQKKAFTPLDPNQPGGGAMPMPPQGGAPMPPQGGAPMPPQGGGEQVDPATGLPIDPQTGMPMDPNTGMLVDPQSGMLIDPASGQMIDPNTGQPVDPNMMGGGGGMPGQEMPMVVGDLPIEEFVALIQQVVADSLANAGAAGPQQPTEETKEKKETTIADLNEKLDMLMSSLGMGAPDQGVPSGMMGAGAGAPVAPPMGMEQQASDNKNKSFNLADMILANVRK